MGLSLALSLLALTFAPLSALKTSMLCLTLLGRPRPQFHTCRMVPKALFLDLGPTSGPSSTPILLLKGESVYPLARSCCANSGQSFVPCSRLTARFPCPQREPFATRLPARVEQKREVKALGGSPLALLPLPGPPGLPSGSSLASLELHQTTLTTGLLYE